MVAKLTTFQFHKIVFTVLVLTSQTLFSQTRKKDSIKEEAIKAVNIYKKNFKEILPAQTLQGEELERLNSHSVADALRYFSGLQIKDYGGMGGMKTVNIRSMGSQHVGVFYDGIQLGNAQNGLVDLGRYSLDDLEEISLYNGQKSEIFQPAKDFGSSGSIYLQPKTPVFTGNRKTNLTIRAKSASIDLFNPSFRLEQKISKRIATSFSAEFLQSDGLYKFRYGRKFPNGATASDTISKRYDSDIKAKRFETSVNGTLNNGSWNIRGYGYISNRGIPAPIVKNRFKARGARMLDETYFVQANFRKKLFPKFETQLKGKFAYDYTYFNDTVRSQAQYQAKNTYIQREVYLSSSNIYSITPNWDVSLSGDFQYNNLDADLRNFSYPTRYTTLVALATTYQWNRFKFLGSLLGTFTSEDVKMNFKADDRREWTPAFFMSYQPASIPELTLRTFYKNIFRLPTFNDLYYTSVGNTFLKPEFTHQYDLGFTYQKKYDKSLFKGLYVKVDGYYNKVTDKIVAVPTTNMFRWMMLNLGKVEIIGADVNVQTEMMLGNVKIKPLLAYTYQSAQDKTITKGFKETYYGEQIPYTPRHSGSFTLMADYKDWSFNYSTIYVGERYDGQQDNIRYNYIQPWYTHDLSVQRKLSLAGHPFKINLEMNNVFNQYYDVVLNYPMPGRNFRLTLNFTL
ncbi:MULTISPECIES: TonB-dependent receptor plug domain-containing protein [unclassified Chryseobacterium]|uniref:TonB-dependent receptor plug domain-containing protein n=1 Tax=unclassified Chryseobacterium TaxID=2593645 RepID=UPI00100B2157|nr:MULTISPECIES: TonB-dependent receptor [unclassified Chryseobacterium]RXM52313.1 TonB-dependent receptor [Chryseobacterium sp. CH25]RXM64219.1 TonB-dependent receptor [Chryseobacterium sp. CH1]